jgi:hypothetical protein
MQGLVYSASYCVAFTSSVAFSCVHVMRCVFMRIVLRCVFMRSRQALRFMRSRHALRFHAYRSALRFHAYRSALRISSGSFFGYVRPDAQALEAESSSLNL